MKDTLKKIECVFRTAPFGVLAFDRNSDVVYVNPLLEANLESVELPFEGKSILDISKRFLLDDRLERKLQKLMADDKPFSIIVETLSSPMVKSSGFVNVIGYRFDEIYVLVGSFVGGGLSRDTRYKHLMENAPDAIVIMNYGRINFSNPAFNKIIDMPPKDIINKNIFDFVDESSSREIDAIRENHSNEIYTRLNINTPSGVKTMEGSFQFIEDRPGTTIAILRDVTEKIVLENRLIRQNEDLAAINMISKTLSSSLYLDEVLQNTLAKVLQIMNIEAGWIYLLDQTKERLKCAYSYGLPEEVTKTIKVLKLCEGIAGRVAVGGEPIIIENASQDPRIKSLAFKKHGIRSFASIPLKSRTCLIGVMNVGSFGQRTISPDDKRLLMTIGIHMGIVMENILLFKEVADTSKDLKNALVLIRQRNDELRSLVSTVSHDLKNPIIAINGFCRRLKRSALSRLNTKEIEYINAIEDSGANMEQFVTNLLTFSALEHLKVNVEEFSIKEILDNIFIEVESILEEKKGVIVYDSQMPVIKADRTRIIQIFSNLISNSIKYAHPQRDLVINLGYQPNVSSHVFYVKDNGVGVPDEHFQNIFEIFFRAYEDLAEGTGLGLSIVKKAVNVMGGDIWLKSDKDQGSVFYFSIPLG